ncbi:MAG TPA: hypothetical protein VLC12_03375, partial [Terriglobales bacterium]|nr:hypothetical protein [Terriglobales bacterium]
MKWLRSATLLVGLAAAAVLASAGDSARLIETNQNHHPAGEFRNGILTLRLEVGKGIWHPESEDGPGVTVYAFGEVGHPLQNPGPLV